MRVHGARAPSLRPREQLSRARLGAALRALRRPLAPVATAEDAPLRPTSVYGITKRDQEELVLVLGRAYGVEAVALRYLNVYGPRQALGNPYTGVAAIFAARLLNGRPPVVFEDGQPDPRPRPRRRRGGRHARGHGRTASAPAHAINIATGRRITVLDLALRLAVALGSSLEPLLPGESRAGDIRHCFADIRRAQALLGFEARRTVEEGLPELAAWVAGQSPTDRGDEALDELRRRGLVT